MLLPVHGGPGELGRLEAVVEVPLAFGIGEEEDLGIGADESDSLSRVNLVAAETAEFRLQNHGCSSAAAVMLKSAAAARSPQLNLRPVETLEP